VTTTETRITAIFAEVLDTELPFPDSDLIAGGVLDSLGLVTLLFEIEQVFGVRLPLESLDIETLRTVEKIADVVDQLAAAENVPLAEGHAS
jgi:acyl carrier protein